MQQKNVLWIVLALIIGIVIGYAVKSTNIMPQDQSGAASRATLTPVTGGTVGGLPSEAITCSGPNAHFYSAGRCSCYSDNNINRCGSDHGTNNGDGSCTCNSTQ